MLTHEAFAVFEEALKVTLSGMAGIFIFMFIFYLAVLTMDRLFPKKIEEDD